MPSIDDDTLAIQFIENAQALCGPIKWSLTTAKSVNGIQGGLKANSLPEHVFMGTDFGIHINESISSIQKDHSGIFSRVAEDHNLTYVDFNSPNEETPDHSIRVWAERSTEPINISPFEIDPNGATPRTIMAGISISVLDPDLIVSPGMSAGNTDAKHYQKISKYLYRYSPGATFHNSLNLHTVNEATRIDSHVKGVRWYSQFIRNMDE